MIKNILITGEPKSGKSTLLNQVIAEVDAKTGFVTNEIRSETSRFGFEVLASTGNSAVLSHVDFQTSHKVSKYSVDVGNLESVLPGVSEFKDGDLLYLDEVGEMQLFSDKFRDLALSYLNAPNTCIATISHVFNNDFTETVKNRNDILLVTLTLENRAEQQDFVSQLIKKIEKARGYIREPEKFIQTDSGVELRSEHGIRLLTKVGGTWACSCDFYKLHSICSHVIAVTEIKFDDLANAKKVF